jgi:hypothetical protein
VADRNSEARMKFRLKSGFILNPDSSLETAVGVHGFSLINSCGMAANE